MKQLLLDKKWRIIFSGLIITALPIIGLALFVNFEVISHIKNEVITDNQQTVLAISDQIKGKIDNDIRMGNLLATRTLLKDAIKKVDRKRITSHLMDFIDHSITVQRAYITNPRGIMLADYPSDPSVLNTDVSQRDWYKGISKKWQPYVSEFYLRVAKPRRSVYAIAIPIRADNSNILGILVLQPQDNYLADAITHIHAFHNQTVYLVDKNGYLIYYSKYAIDKIIDFSNLPAVQKVKNGQKGAETFSNQAGERMFTAYQPVEGLGWGVVVERPEKKVFATLREITIGLFAFASIMLLTGVYFAYKRSELIYSLQKFSEELEKKVSERTIELKLSNDALKNYAHVISHDLRAPLITIGGFANLLARRYKGKLDDKADEVLEEIINGANRMQELIKDLLEYSQSGIKKQELKPTDCTSAVKKAADNLSALIEANRAVLTYDNLPTIIADPSQLISLFQNLIENAIKFRSADTPEINISAKQKEKQWIFCIQDNGVGVSPNDSERIFGMFQRLDNTAERSGTGIGLATCKQIVERHGGSIWVESEVGKGSKFYFTISCIEL